MASVHPHMMHLRGTYMIRDILCYGNIAILQLHAKIQRTKDHQLHKKLWRLKVDKIFHQSTPLS